MQGPGNKLHTMFKGRKEKDSKKTKGKDDDKAPEVEDKKRILPDRKADDDSVVDDEEERKKREEEKKKKEEEERRRKREEERRKEEAKTKRDEDRRKKKEIAEKKKQEEERRRAEEAEDDETEIQDLESVPLEGGLLYKEMYRFFPFTEYSEVFSSYDKLHAFARELNTLLPTPEIVVIGYQGHGKSSLIEGFMGHHVSPIGYGATKRPLFLTLINNIKCEKPKCTIKRDSLLKGTEFDHDIVVGISELVDELQKRNKLTKPCDEPIIVHYEYRYCCNVTLIDTPGLILKEDEVDQAKEVQAIVYNLVRIPERLILCVEEAKDWDKWDMFDIIKQVDPEFSRTTFAYTKFHFHLQKFISTRQVNRFLQGTLPDSKCFFTSMLSNKVRSKFSDSDKFQEKLYQAYRRDMRALEQLQYDRGYEGTIGVLQLRQHLLNIAWKKFQDDIPQVLKRLRANREETEGKLRQIQQQLEGLTSSKLRSLASDYVVQFLHCIDKLLLGTSEGNPAVNGQSLEEEKTQFGVEDWLDSHNKPIRFDYEDWGIPYWDSKLYGGQQFERLLAEFKAVADHQKLPEVSMDDIATAAGINKLNNIPNYAWAASDLAQQKSHEELLPLIEQTTRRAVYILKRLTDIADRMLEARKRSKWENTVQPVDVNNIDMYPFFTYHVKDLFSKFVEKVATQMLSKCLDEFYSTRTIFWEYTEYADRNLPLDRSDAEETKKAVDSLARELFTRLRERITKNILLKFYNFLLVPMQTELWSEIQGRISTLSDEQLDQIFEVNATKSKLKEDEKALRQLIEHYSQQEELFLEASTHFSHPVYAALEKK
jgi:hypothetical protein